MANEASQRQAPPPPSGLALWGTRQERRSVGGGTVQLRPRLSPLLSPPPPKPFPNPILGVPSSSCNEWRSATDTGLLFSRRCTAPRRCCICRAPKHTAFGGYVLRNPAVPSLAPGVLAADWIGVCVLP